MTLTSWLARLKKSCRRSPQKNRSRASLRLEPLEQRLNLSAMFPEFVDPNPAPGNQFGASVVPLSTGNVVITSPFDDAGGPDAGAVYLFNGSTGALISTLRGSSAADNVGGGGVTALENGNFVVSSTNWDNGALTNAGAVTWGDGTIGIAGIVSPANSLVGGTPSDGIGSGGVTALPSGNYVVHSPNWDNVGALNAGAVTWGDGAVGVAGIVSAANSLVGTSRLDRIGSGGVTVLTNGNYVLHSPGWDDGALSGVGAVTWGSGTVGVMGAVSASNSLIGSARFDGVGSTEVTALSNGNYVVVSTSWDNGAAANAGAVTWGSGTAGVVGAVSPANSLVGSTSNDRVGSGVTVLPNDNYVVNSPSWDDGAVTDAGAVTWGSGTAGVVGAVSAANSLVGSQAGDGVGGDVTALSNSNYVVSSGNWDNGSISDAGAVTWVDGSTGVTGVVSAGNSLIGSSAGDKIGGTQLFPGFSIPSAVTALSNGNYVVHGIQWDNGTATNAGAATWGSGTTGVVGVVSPANSLVGSTEYDYVGFDVVELANGNYVVGSTNWDNGAATNAGAVTWGSGTTGVTGVVSAANSLIGSQASDVVGWNITPLANGNYVVTSQYWDNGAIPDAGAATWGDGTSGTTGVVSAANSLVGSSAEDQLGTGFIMLPSGILQQTAGVVPLANGNYVVQSVRWDNGAAANAGAATWGDGTTGVSGVISAANSLVGSHASDGVGSLVDELSNGNYLVSSRSWDNGAATNAGAVTWGSGTTGVTGVVSAANSLVGSSAYDEVGSGGVTALANGNYVVRSWSWDDFLLTDAGAVTFGNGATGVVGPVTSVNSIKGTMAKTSLRDVVVDNVNDTFFARFLADGGGRVWIGSQENGFFTGPVGMVGNDLVAQTDAGNHRLIFSVNNAGDVMVRLDGTTYGPFSFPGKIIAYGGDGNDIMTVASAVMKPAEFHGGDGDDYLAGGTMDDILVGGPGNDRVLGGEGNNVLIGDDIGGEAPTDGDDRLLAGDGNDVLIGGGGSDYLVGAGGDDVLDGGSGDDQLSGGFGNDILIGGAGNDALQGYYGDDVLLGGEGNDRAFGGNGRDLVVGGGGSDQLWGDQDDDTLVAGTSDLDNYSFNPLAHNANRMALLQLLADWADSGDDSGLTGIADDALIDTLYDWSGTNTAKGTGGNDRIYGNFM